MQLRNENFVLSFLFEENLSTIYSSMLFYFFFLLCIQISHFGNTCHKQPLHFAILLKFSDNTQCVFNSRIISRMVTGWDSVAGALGPAILYARTRNCIFSPVGRSRMITEFLSVRPSNAGIHSSARGNVKQCKSLQKHTRSPQKKPFQVFPFQLNSKTRAAALYIECPNLCLC